MLALNNDLMAALTIYGEARGEPFIGKMLVAAVIFNRSLIGEIYRGDESLQVARAVLRARQFSCWNTGDVNRMAIAEATVDSHLYRECLDAWRVHKYLAIPLNVKHYHATNVTPYWADPKNVFAREGNHVFYAGID